MSGLDAAKFIIENTPIGLLNDINNYIKLIDEKLTYSSEYNNIIKTYEEDHFKQIPLENDKSLITNYNKDKDNFYHDQTKKYKFQILPLSENFEKLEKLTNENILQTLIEKEITNYQNKYYTKDNTSHNVFYKELDDGNFQVNIEIGSQIIKVEMNHSGEWLSHYLLTKVKNNEYNLKGEIHIKTYYFEDNHSHFHLNDTINENFSAKNDEEISKKIIEIIEKKENQIQVKCNDIFDNFNENIMKPLRRKVSLTSTKMNWNINQLSLKDYQ